MRQPMHLLKSRLPALLLALAIGPAAANAGADAPRIGQPRASSAAPFVENRGQVPSVVRYYAHHGASSVWFEPHSVLLDRAPEPGRSGMRMRVEFTGAEELPVVQAAGAIGDPHHFALGAHETRTAASWPEVRYRNAGPGADVVYRIEQGRLKYDVSLAAGADPAGFAMRYHGATRLALSEDGALVIETPAGTLREDPPFLYQELAGMRIPVRGGFRILGDDTFGFWADGYDRELPLVVDPSLAWSSFLGGGGADVARAVTSDASGNVYVVGDAASTNYPASPGAYDVTGDTAVDAFVTKLSPSGAMVWSTFLGGSGGDNAYAVAVDGSGSVYVAGATSSADFPVTGGCFDNTLAVGNFDIFVAKLSSNGSRVTWATYLGGAGSDSPRGIAVDASGRVTVAGGTGSIDFPTTPNVVKPTRNPALFDGSDGFVTRLNANGSALEYSTYLGTNSGADVIYGVALDGAGQATVAGWTVSPGFPTTATAFDRTIGLQHDAFVTRLNATGSAYVFSTLLGGNGADDAYAVAVDAGGYAYVTGFTGSTDFPTTSGALQRSMGSAYDAFVTKLRPDGTALSYSTYVGGGANEMGYGISVSGSGEAVVTGYTESTNFPTTTDAADRSANGGADLFALALSASGGSLLHSTYLGGTGTDVGYAAHVRAADSRAVVVGHTASSGFPTSSGAFDTSHNSPGTADGMISVLDMHLSSGSQLAVGDEPAALGIELAPPFPNPSRSAVQFTLSLEAAGNVRVTVLDLKGRTVQVVHDGSLGAGTHRLAWSGDDTRGGRAPAGRYFVRVSTPSAASSRGFTRLD